MCRSFITNFIQWNCISWPIKLQWIRTKSEIRAVILNRKWKVIDVLAEIKEVRMNEDEKWVGWMWLWVSMIHRNAVRISVKLETCSIRRNRLIMFFKILTFKKKQQKNPHRQPSKGVRMDILNLFPLTKKKSTFIIHCSFFFWRW